MAMSNEEIQKMIIANKQRSQQVRKSKVYHFSPACNHTL
jgi:hypothetical protein